MYKLLHTLDFAGQVFLFEFKVVELTPNGRALQQIKQRQSGMTHHSPPVRKPIAGWQLNVLIIVGTVLLTNVVVALVNWLVRGGLAPDAMKISTISGLIIATLAVSVAGKLRARVAAANRQQLELSVERAQGHLALAIESAQMLFWEFDLISGQFSYDKGRRAWLGLPMQVEANNFNDWLALVHPDDQAPLLQKMQAARDPGAPDFRFDYRMRQADDSWGWVHTQGRVSQRNAQGTAVLAVGSTLNIHQRKQAELTVQENIERLDIIFNNNPELMLISRAADGLITEVNEAFVRITGFSRAQAIGNTTLGLGIWVDAKERERLTQALLAHGRCDNLETVFVTQSGEHIDSELNAVCTPIHGVPHIVSTVRDIRARKRAVAEQHRSEALLRATLASTDEGIILLDQANQVLSVNPRFLAMWRAPAELAVQRRDGQLLAHVLAALDDADSFENQVDQLICGDEVARGTLALKDGRVFASFTQSLQVAGHTGRIWCFKDITQQTRDQQALVQSLNLLEAVINHSPIRIFWKDVDLRYLGCNQVFARDAGLSSPADLIGKLDTDFSWSIYAEAYIADDRQVLASGKARLAFEERQTRPDGQSLWLRTSKVPIYGHNQELIGVLGMYEDITAQKQTTLAVDALNAELIERTQFLSALMEAIPIPIFYKDAHGIYLGFNKAYEDFIGLSRSELVGKSVFDIAPAHLADIYHAQDLALMAGQGVQQYETQVTNSAGELREVMLSKSFFTDHQGQIKGLIGGVLDITERKHAEQSVQTSERRTQTLYSLLRRVADNVPDMIWAKDLDKRFLFVNKAICEQLLMARDTDEPLGKDDLFFALRQRNSQPDNPSWHTFGELCQDSDAITLASGQAAQFDEFGNVRGQLLHLDVRKAPLIGDNGAVIGVVGSARDVTAERATQEKLQVAAAVLTNSSEALILTDADNCIMDVNPAFTRLTGYTLAEVTGKDPRVLHSGKQGEAFYHDMWSQIKATGRWQGEIWNRRKDGEIYAEWLTINTLANADGSVRRRVGLFSDITDRKRSEERVWMQANFDGLTSLPNRRMFLNRLEQDLKKAHRGGFKLALMFVDLDHFKEINDTLGHDVGDLLLKQAAARISACARESDTVARIGGDEFTVILAELQDTAGIDRVAQDILATLAQPFELGQGPCFVSASIGITLYPSDATRVEDLMKNADQAMYVSKDAGRGRFSYFTRAMQNAAMYRLHLQEDLRQALTEQQFVLHYQPIVALPGGQIHKAEALLRWTHPVRGAVSPAEFIALAEDCGLIHALGDWVFAQAAAQAKDWRTRLDPSFQVSVNLSPLQIQTGAEQFHWQAHLQAQQLSGDAVLLEITEGLLLNKSAAVAAALLAYRDAGIGVAIDDFGTGYSAMAYLRQLHIDYLKIDQSFVRNLGQQASDQALCEAMVVMAHKLGLRVIAEGVETALQRDLLQAMGCDFAQGYLFAKALPAAEFELLLTSPS